MSGRKALVVEDSPTEMGIAVAALRQRGYQIVTAEDGEEALEKMARERPDLVVLDVVLPKKNGFQVCREIKTSADWKSIPVILLTSKTQESDRFWGMKQGADEYLTKPYQDSELLAAVARRI